LRSDRPDAIAELIACCEAAEDFPMLATTLERVLALETEPSERARIAERELVGWTRELSTTTRDEPGGTWRRPAWIAALAIGTLLLVWCLLALVDLARVEGLAIEAVGALCALAALVVVRRLARNQGSAPAGD
jgi:hypothetical protein